MQELVLKIANSGKISDTLKVELIKAAYDYEYKLDEHDSMIKDLDKGYISPLALTLLGEKAKEFEELNFEPIDLRQKIKERYTILPEAIVDTIMLVLDVLSVEKKRDILEVMDSTNLRAAEFILMEIEPNCNEQFKFYFSGVIAMLAAIDTASFHGVATTATEGIREAYDRHDLDDFSTSFLIDTINCIDLFDDELSGKIIHNIKSVDASKLDHDKADKCLNNNDVCGFLDNAFVWEKTPEGFGFWQDISQLFHTQKSIPSELVEIENLLIKSDKFNTVTIKRIIRNMQSHPIFMEEFIKVGYTTLIRFLEQKNYTRFLDKAFRWSRTSEGFKFWKDITEPLEKEERQSCESELIELIQNAEWITEEWVKDDIIAKIKNSNHGISNIIHSIETFRDNNGYIYLTQLFMCNSNSVSMDYWGMIQKKYFDVRLEAFKDKTNQYLRDAIDGCFLIDADMKAKILACIKEFGVHYDRRHDCVSVIKNGDVIYGIKSSFWWSYTPEGHEYWRDYFEKISNQSNENGIDKIKSLLRACGKFSDVLVDNIIYNIEACDFTTEDEYDDLISLLEKGSYKSFLCVAFLWKESREGGDYWVKIEAEL